MAKKTKDNAAMWGRIDRLRMEREWTWRELATRAGKNPTQLTASKSAGTSLLSETLDQVAKALGTTSRYLLTGEGQQADASARPSMLASFVADVEQSKIVEWAEAQPAETRPTMAEIARALELVHVETSASGGIFYSTSDGVPVRDWGVFFADLRGGKIGTTIATANAKVQAGPFAAKAKKST